MTAPVITLPGATGELMPEEAVLKQWPLLSKDELRQARAAEKIGWVKGKQGSAWYRPEAVRAYIRDYKERKACLAPAPKPSLNSEASGSPTIPTAECFTDSGLSPALEEHAAQASAQRILGKPN